MGIGVVTRSINSEAAGVAAALRTASGRTASATTAATARSGCGRTTPATSSCTACTISDESECAYSD